MQGNHGQIADSDVLCAINLDATFSDATQSIAKDHLTLSSASTQPFFSRGIMLRVPIGWCIVAVVFRMYAMMGTENWCRCGTSRMLTFEILVRVKVDSGIYFSDDGGSKEVCLPNFPREAQAFH